MMRIPTIRAAPFGAIRLFPCLDPGFRDVRNLTSLHPGLSSGRHVVAEPTAKRFPVSLRSSPGYSRHLFHLADQLSLLTPRFSGRRELTRPSLVLSEAVLVLVLVIDGSGIIPC